MQAGEVNTGAWTNDLQLPLLSTVAYFGINTYADGSLVTNDFGYQVWGSSQTTTLIDRAHAAGDRVVLTVKSFDDPTIATVTGNEPNRQRLIANIVNQITLRNVDGVNIDFEGFNSSVAPYFTLFVNELHAALHGQTPQSSYLTVDTYASAAWGGTMYDITGLAPYVDAFMVMAYDITYSGSAHAGPVAPLDGETFADVNTVSHFLAKVPAGQVILGVPYYGYKWSTADSSAQSQTLNGGAATADTYSAAVDDVACEFAHQQSFTASFDNAFYSPWASWYSPASADPCGGNRGSWRELYYENAQSLGGKYDLVNNNNLRGIGIWALGYDSGHGELWNEIASKFTVQHIPQVQVTPLAATQNTTQFTLNWQLAPGSVTASRYAVFVRDASASWHWLITTTATSVALNGFPGHSYDAYVEAFAPNGDGSGAPTANGQTSTAVGAAASTATPFASLYAVDANGLLRPGSSPVMDAPGSWSWDIIRGITADAGARGGVVLDGFGGLHPYGDSPGPTPSTYWQGWDIATGITQLPNNAGGYVLDGFGGLHPYTLTGHPAPPIPVISQYWSGWKIARSVTSFADGSGGLVLDGWGGLHPFGVASGPKVVAPRLSVYWAGWDIARSVVLLPGSTAAHYSGYVLDGWGGLHGFAGGADALPAATPSAYWQGWDIARAAVVIPGTSAGYVVDGWGAFHPFNNAPSVVSGSFIPGQDLVRGAAIG